MILLKNPERLDRIRASGVPESWECVDCGVNTAPGFMNARQMYEAFEGGQDNLKQSLDNKTEVYQLNAAVWRKAAREDIDKVFCIGCLEERLGRKLRPRDFDVTNELNMLPGSARLLSRRDRR